MDLHKIKYRTPPTDGTLVLIGTMRPTAIAGDTAFRMELATYNEYRNGKSVWLLHNTMVELPVHDDDVWSDVAPIVEEATCPR